MSFLLLLFHLDDFLSLLSIFASSTILFLLHSYGTFQLKYNETIFWCGRWPRSQSFTHRSFSAKLNLENKIKIAILFIYILFFSFIMWSYKSHESFSWYFSFNSFRNWYFKIARSIVHFAYTDDETKPQQRMIDRLDCVNFSL